MLFLNTSVVKITSYLVKVKILCQNISLAIVKNRVERFIVIAQCLTPIVWKYKAAENGYTRVTCKYLNIVLR